MAPATLLAVVANVARFALLACSEYAAKFALATVPVILLTFTLNASPAKFA